MNRNPRHTLSGILLLTAAAVLLLAGCRKELCYNHWEHGYNVRAQVIPEWELEWRRDSAAVCSTGSRVLSRHSPSLLLMRKTGLQEKRTTMTVGACSTA